MILVGLGANLEGVDGLPEQALQIAVERLDRAGVSVVKASNIWESAPVPISEQPWYKNAVCEVKTSLSAHDLLKVLANIEEEAGRIRYKKNEARVLDLDLLAYNDLIIEEKHLQIPHPRMHMRAFVLYPLQEIAPKWKHPLLKKHIDNMIEALDPEQKVSRMSKGLLKVDYDG